MEFQGKAREAAEPSSSSLRPPLNSSELIPLLLLLVDDVKLGDDRNTHTQTYTNDFSQHLHISF